MRSLAVVVCAASPVRIGLSSVLAENLAVLLAGRRHKVLLLDMCPQQDCVAWGAARAHARLRPRVTVEPAGNERLADRLERAHSRFDHVVIDAGVAGTHAARRALIAARVALVAVPAERTDECCPPSLAALLADVRMFNPGLRILCLPVSGDTVPATDDMANLLAEIDPTPSRPSRLFNWRPFTA